MKVVKVLRMEEVETIHAVAIRELTHVAVLELPNGKQDIVLRFQMQGVFDE